MLKKKVTKNKQKIIGSFFWAQVGLNDAIVEVIRLQANAFDNKDMIAQWVLGELYEDLVKLSNRLGNIQLTIKGKRK